MVGRKKIPELNASLNLCCLQVLLQRNLNGLKLPHKSSFYFVVVAKIFLGGVETIPYSRQIDVHWISVFPD